MLHVLNAYILLYVPEPYITEKFIQNIGSTLFCVRSRDKHVQLSLQPVFVKVPREKTSHLKSYAIISSDSYCYFSFWTC